MTRKLMIIKIQNNRRIWCILLENMLRVEVYLRGGCKIAEDVGRRCWMLMKRDGRSSRQQLRDNSLLSQFPLRASFTRSYLLRDPNNTRINRGESAPGRGSTSLADTNNLPSHWWSIGCEHESGGKLYKRSLPFSLPPPVVRRLPTPSSLLTIPLLTFSPPSSDWHEALFQPRSARSVSISPRQNIGYVWQHKSIKAESNFETSLSIEAWRDEGVVLMLGGCIAGLKGERVNVMNAAVMTLIKDNYKYLLAKSINSLLI